MILSRRGLLAGLLAAPAVAALPDILRPSVFSRAVTIGVDWAAKGRDYVVISMVEAPSPTIRRVLYRAGRVSADSMAALLDGRDGAMIELEDIGDIFLLPAEP